MNIRHIKGKFKYEMTIFFSKKVLSLQSKMYHRYVTIEKVLVIDSEAIS